MLLKATTGQVFVILNVLNNINSQSKVLEITSKGKVSLAVNIETLRTIAIPFEINRNNEWRKIAPSVFDDEEGTINISKASPTQRKEMDAAAIDLASQEIEVVVQTFTFDDFKLDKNPTIDSDMLIILKPLISDWPKGDSTDIVKIDGAVIPPTIENSSTTH